MRIGLNLLFLIPNEVGGTETYSISLLNELGKIDNSNEYYVFINKETRKLGLRFGENFRLIKCAVAGRNRLARFLWEQILIPLQTKKYKLNIVHSLGYISPLFLPCKSIVTIHDLNYLFIPDSFNFFSRQVQRFFVSHSARRCDHIIVVSHFIRNQVVKALKVKEDKISVIHEAPKKRMIDWQKTNISLDDLQEKLQIKYPYLLAFSSFSPHKNLHRLLQAFAIYNQNKQNDYQLVIIGNLPIMNPSLDDLRAKLGLTEKVILTGFLPDNWTAMLLHYADLFIFPSCYEGFGLPVLEAMQFGVPVICSYAGSIPEVAGDAALYFDPLNVKEMADCIHKILADQNGRQSLKKRGEKNLERFSWAKAAQQTNSIYQKIMDE